MGTLVAGIPSPVSFKFKRGSEKQNRRQRELELKKLELESRELERAPAGGAETRGRVSDTRGGDEHKVVGKRGDVQHGHLRRTCLGHVADVSRACAASNECSTGTARREPVHSQRV